MSALMQEMGAKALKLGIPLSVQLDLTYRCNERCVHCYLDHDDHGEMTAAEIKNLLGQLAEAGVFFLILSGGEIFLRKDLFEIVEYARRLSFSVKLKTNAVMIRKARAQRIAALGVESVQISVYSHRAEIHDAITKLPGSFRRTMEGARFLKSNGVRVSFANVLMKHNSNDYPKVQALAADLGVGYNVDATITPMMDGNRSTLGLNVDPETLEEVFHDSSLVGNAEEFCAPPSGPLEEERCSGHAALQRRPYRLLHLPLWGRISLRAVPVSQRQRAENEVPGNLAALAAAGGSAVGHFGRPPRLLILRARKQLFALPGAGLYGREHARPLYPGLRKILCAHAGAVGAPPAETGCGGRAGINPRCRNSETFIGKPSCHLDGDTEVGV